MKAMTPNRPYLLQAYYDWLMDNDLTPHVVVDAYVPGTQVPQQYVKDGQIVLNIASTAVGNLQIGHDFIEFNARFGGVPQQVVLPMAANVAIYARENGPGTVFEAEEAYQDAIASSDTSSLSVVDEAVDKQDSEPTQASEEKPVKRGHLTLVK